MIKKFIKLFLPTFILTIISSPKPICDFTHSDGWVCTSFPLHWIRNFMYKTRMIPYVENYTYEDILIEYGFDLFIVILISLLVTFIYIFLRKKLLSYKSLRKIALVIIYLVIFSSIRYILQIPYKTYPERISDWQEQPIYRPISGGYE